MMRHWYCRAPGSVSLDAEPMTTAVVSAGQSRVLGAAMRATGRALMRTMEVADPQAPLLSTRRRVM